ncbi:unnamed protein product [Ophioblennius macclurei]
MDSKPAALGPGSLSGRRNSSAPNISSSSSSSSSSIIITLLIVIIVIFTVLPGASSAAMQRLLPAAVLQCVGLLVGAQPDEPGLTERSYVVLEKQNLVVLGSVLGVLLLLMIIMAVCVYKPLAGR